MVGVNSVSCRYSVYGDAFVRGFGSAVASSVPSSVETNSDSEPDTEVSWARSLHGAWQPKLFWKPHFTRDMPAGFERGLVPPTNPWRNLLPPMLPTVPSLLRVGPFQCNPLSTSSSLR